MKSFVVVKEGWRFMVYDTSITFSYNPENVLLSFTPISESPEDCLTAHRFAIGYAMAERELYREEQERLSKLPISIDLANVESY